MRHNGQERRAPNEVDSLCPGETDVAGVCA